MAAAPIDHDKMVALLIREMSAVKSSAVPPPSPEKVYRSLCFDFPQVSADGMQSLADVLAARAWPAWCVITPKLVAGVEYVAMSREGSAGAAAVAYCLLAFRETEAAAPSASADESKSEQPAATPAPLYETVQSSIVQSVPTVAWHSIHGLVRVCSILSRQVVAWSSGEAVPTAVSQLVYVLRDRAVHYADEAGHVAWVLVSLFRTVQGAPWPCVGASPHPALDLMVPAASASAARLAGSANAHEAAMVMNQLVLPALKDIVCCPAVAKSAIQRVLWTIIATLVPELIAWTRLVRSSAGAAFRSEEPATGSLFVGLLDGICGLLEFYVVAEDAGAVRMDQISRALQHLCDCGGFDALLDLADLPQPQIQSRLFLSVQRLLSVSHAGAYRLAAHSSFVHALTTAAQPPMSTLLIVARALMYPPASAPRPLVSMFSSPSGGARGGGAAAAAPAPAVPAPHASLSEALMVLLESRLGSVIQALEAASVPSDPAEWAGFSTAERAEINNVSELLQAAVPIWSFVGAWTPFKPIGLQLGKIDQWASAQQAIMTRLAAGLSADSPQGLKKGLRTSSPLLTNLRRLLKSTILSGSLSGRSSKAD